MISKSQILEREKRWTLIAGIASVMGVAIILASYGESSAAVRAASGLAESLREVDGARSTLLIASIGQFLGWSLLAVPLAFVFKAAAARSPRVRPGLIGVVVAAPILIGAGGLLSAGSILQAATDFKDVDRAAIERCAAEKEEEREDADAEEGEEAEDPFTECEDEAARDIRTNTSLAPLETGIGIAGLLGFTVAVIYVSLWGMRTGLLSRFWGSLGIALGAVFAFFTLFTLIWFIYIGLLLAGWVPGGRPPAWASGEAEPWPKPGEQDSDEDVIEGTASEVDPDRDEIETGQPPAGAPGAEPDGPDDGSGGERRKRKKRG